MILGIDGANLRGGGGVTHIVELLRAADPPAQGFSKVIVWSSRATLHQIEDRPWLEKINPSELEHGLLQRSLWQKFKLAKAAENSGCDVLLVPGGSYSGNFQPFVTMSRNLLPFEWKEMRRYSWSLYTLKLLLLRYTQGQTFKQTNGLIFLTRYAQNIVSKIVRIHPGKTIVIPHGIHARFFGNPRPQKSISAYSPDQPFKILYVSIVDMYKHQWCVVEAVAMLRKKGFPVELILVGPAIPRALQRLQKTLAAIDPPGDYIKYIGPIPHQQLNGQYAKSDLCLFASSCENMPNILLEGMASGLPMVCSNKGPMPEVLGDGGVYFDPEHPDDIADALLMMIKSPELRERLAKKSFQKAHIYSWKRCANETFRFLRQIAVEEKYKTRRKHSRPINR